MGGGGRYPYPKYVWSPAGGWWSQPANWKMNTFIASCGLALACGAIFFIGLLRSGRVGRRAVRTETTHHNLATISLPQSGR
ncbi:hypothetical protein B0H17DRAFT_323071 [Mycena rosella]|uniref:Uncharacterized protein n=1 Tax=Mycena rosella TaxID=1033263 RepID=A0AAD7CSM5_MYCRO|nr:hypothetical protein B0H17DRAFT_323071 [Mycena rosella]